MTDRQKVLFYYATSILSDCLELFDKKIDINDFTEFERQYIESLKIRIKEVLAKDIEEIE